MKRVNKFVYVHHNVIVFNHRSNKMAEHDKKN